MGFRFNSVVFTTKNLSAIRAFYEGTLEFPTGTYQKNGDTLPDFSESYVNYHIDGGLIGFEIEEASKPPGVGDIVIKVSDFTALRIRLENSGVKILKSNPAFFMIQDPESRTLIFEPN